jgi:acyl carrier protein
MTTFERFQEVLKPIINAEVRGTTTLRDLNLDPLDLFHLITDLEEEFQIEIDDQVAEKFKVISEIITYIDKKLAAK